MSKRMRKLISIGVLAFSLTASAGSAAFAEEAAADAVIEAASETPATEAPTPPPETQPPAPETQAPAPETQAPAPETQAPAPETQAPAPETQTSAPETQAPATEGQTSAPATEAQTSAPETQTPASETQSAETQKATETAAQSELEETEAQTVSENGPAQDEMLHDIGSASEVAVQIVGFSVDPSQYPSANITEVTNKIYKYLTKEMKMNHAAACGILANVHLESNFSPLALGDGGTSYGICQWHAGRFNNLISYCNGKDLDYNTLEGQLDFLEYELKTSYPGVLEYVMNVPNTADGAYDAAHYWCVYFEAPSETYARAAQRGNLARNNYFPQKFDADGVREENVTVVREIRDLLSGEGKKGNSVADVRSLMSGSENKEIAKETKSVASEQNPEADEAESRIAALFDKQ